MVARPQTPIEQARLLLNCSGQADLAGMGRARYKHLPIVRIGETMGRIRSDRAQPSTRMIHEEATDDVISVTQPPGIDRVG